jgi:type IV secretory pathway VirB3-like protein
MRNAVADCVTCNPYLSRVLVSSAMQVVMKNDGNFMEVIHLYLEAGINYYLPKVFRPALKVVVKNDRNFMKLILLFLKSEKHCFLKIVM